MKRILGLDLGVSSIGWAIVDIPEIEPVSNDKTPVIFPIQINEKTSEKSTPLLGKDSEPKENINIVGLGCLLINNSSETLRDFQKGIGENPNTHRRHLRNRRNRYRYYKRRRNQLVSFLKKYNMVPKTREDDKMQLWFMRNKASKEKLELEELGQVILHLARKRGHVSGSKVEDGKTIGEYFFRNLIDNPNFRIRGFDFSRAEHIRELETILRFQSNYYPDILTKENCDLVTNRIIFKENRRKNKAATKRLCVLESKEYLNSLEENIQKNNKKYSPCAALRSNPIYQIFNTLCQLQHIRLECNREGIFRPLMTEEQTSILKFLQIHPFLPLKDIPLQLGLGRNVKCIKVDPTPDLPLKVTSYKRKITGNQVYTELHNIMGEKYQHLLRFDIPSLTTLNSTLKTYSSSIYNNEHNCELEKEGLLITSSLLEQPLYKFWRDLFSIRDKKALEKVLVKKYSIQEKEILDKLCALNFYLYGFSDISVKAIRRLLPYMFRGMPVHEAYRKLGYSKSSVSFIEKNVIEGKDKKMRLLKGKEVSNPIVEKVLNKLVTVVNKLIKEYGPFDQINIEHARELGRSSLERQKYYVLCQRNEQDKNRYRKKLLLMGLPDTYKILIKFKLWEETDGSCIYCGEKIPQKGYLTGALGDVEHIIPKSMQFNDSFNNKVCSCRKCNQAKGSMTAFDFMKSQGEKHLKCYTQRIETLTHKNKISPLKRDNLLTKASELSDEFISSQLTASRYISTKAMSMLKEICPNVIWTFGIFTRFLRNQWGYETILHDLNLSYYALLSNVKGINVKDIDCKPKNKIHNWSKRLDHRHHCIDALVIALTSKDFMDRIAHLNAHRKSDTLSPEDQSLYSSDNIALSQLRPCISEVSQTLEKVIVVHSPNEDKVRWSYRNTEHGHIRTLTPKAALHRESIYGEITRVDAKGKPCRMKVVRVPLEEIDSEKKILRIVDPQLRSVIQSEFEKAKVDKKTKEEKETGVTIEETDTSTSKLGIFSDNEILNGVRAVRSLSYHQNLTPLRYNDKGEAIGFVRTDNNHHVSIYRLPNGKMVEKVVSFFDYAKLRRLALHGVITDPKAHCDDVSRKNIILDSVLQKCIPPKDAEHVLTLIKNQLYILGLTEDQIKQAFERKDLAFLSRHIYRVQGISSCNYRFSLHTQSETSLKNFNRPDGRFLLYSSLSKFMAANPTRVIVDTIGRIRLLQI